MNLDLDSWRASIGCYQSCRSCIPKHPLLPSSMSIITPSIFICHILLVFCIYKNSICGCNYTSHSSYPMAYSLQVLPRISIILLLLISGNVHPNPGPSTFNFMHYNVNSLKAFNFSRVQLIESFLTIQNLDIAAISETALDNSINNENIEIEGFSILRKDLTNNHTHGGVLLYYKNNLALKHCPDLEFDPNVIVTELHFGKKKVYLTVLYRRPSQTIEQFQLFAQNFDKLCSQINNKNPYASIYMGDFNARNRSWWSGDQTNNIVTKF